jgi:hypothetical protein
VSSILCNKRFELCWPLNGGETHIGKHLNTTASTPASPLSRTTDPLNKTSHDKVVGQIRGGVRYAARILIRQDHVERVTPQFQPVTSGPSLADKFARNYSALQMGPDGLKSRRDHQTRDRISTPIGLSALPQAEDAGTASKSV